jgi:hypothetical protein
VSFLLVIFSLDKQRKVTRASGAKALVLASKLQSFKASKLQSFKASKLRSTSQNKVDG